MTRTLFNLNWLANRLLRAVGVAGLILLLGANRGIGEDASFTEYQVKALFLLNFAKYVDWPSETFPDPDSPIIIGILGKDPFGDKLEHAVRGKAVNGHAFLIKHLASSNDLKDCQILFISDSEAGKLDEILSKSKTLPILTVGEDKTFWEDGGIIDLVLKDDRVRLRIDLKAADQAGLKVSSKLLAVADEVKGKAE